MTDHPAPGRFEFTEARLTAAMASAMRDVLTDPEVIERQAEVLLAVLQRQAAQKTGSFLLGALRTFVTRWMVIGFLLLLVAKYLGVDAAVRMWDTVKGKP